MAGSLRDQLVKAGLATTAQAKKAETQKRVESRTQRQAKTSDKSTGKSAGKSDDSANVRQRARRLNTEKSQRDKAIARERNKKFAARALRAEIKQIILQNDQRAKANADSDVPYNFIHGKKVKKIYVPAAQKALLSTGHLVIVNNDGLYHLVTPGVAEQIATRDPKRIIVAHQDKPAEPTADDEHYAKFAVPDDLEW